MLIARDLSQVELFSVLIAVTCNNNNNKISVLGTQQYSVGLTTKNICYKNTIISNGTLLLLMC